MNLLTAYLVPEPLLDCLTRFNKIAIQGTPQMAAPSLKYLLTILLMQCRYADFIKLFACQWQNDRRGMYTKSPIF